MVQEAVPTALSEVTLPWKASIRNQFQEQAQTLCRALSRARGLSIASPPAGAMYVLVRIDGDILPDFSNEVEFSQALLREENVLVLPGSCFGMAQVFRVVFGAPPAVLQAAADRIVAFCERHARE